MLLPMYGDGLSPRQDGRHRMQLNIFRHSTNMLSNWTRQSIVYHVTNYTCDQRLRRCQSNCPAMLVIFADHQDVGTYVMHPHAR